MYKENTLALIRVCLFASTWKMQLIYPLTDEISNPVYYNTVKPVYNRQNKELMPWLHLPLLSYDLFVYDFLYNFFGIIGGYKLQRMCLHCLRSPSDFFRRQTRTKAYRPCGYRTITARLSCSHMLSSQPPHIKRRMPVQ